MAPNPNAYPMMFMVAVNNFSEHVRRLENEFPGIRLTLRFRGSGWIDPPSCYISLSYCHYNIAIVTCVDEQYIDQAVERLESNFKTELIKYGLTAMKVMSEIPAP